MPQHQSSHQTKYQAQYREFAWRDFQRTLLCRERFTNIRKGIIRPYTVPQVMVKDDEGNWLAGGY